MNANARNAIRPPAKIQAPGESGMFPAVRVPAAPKPVSERPPRARSSKAPRARKHAGFTHMGFRLTPDHAAIVRAAADAKGLKTSEYMRDLVLEWAASDVGITRPDTRVYAYRNIVEEVARAKGLSVRQYEAHVAREQAKRELGIR